VGFFCVCGSSSDMCLEFCHLLFLPWVDQSSAHVGERCGDVCGWVAHGIVVSVGKSEDAEVD